MEGMHCGVTQQVQNAPVEIYLCCALQIEYV